jgi:hypothetical protein
MPRIAVALRTPKARAAMAVTAIAIAAVAAWGGSGASTVTGPSDAAAIAYVRTPRLDLGAPGIASRLCTDRTRPSPAPATPPRTPRS